MDIEDDEEDTMQVRSDSKMFSKYGCNETIWIDFRAEHQMLPLQVRCPTQSPVKQHRRRRQLQFAVVVGIGRALKNCLSYQVCGVNTWNYSFRFFQRSASTLCAGYPPPDPFQTPLCNALPLADQPQLLQPNARREDMFGMSSQNFIGDAKHQHSLYMLPTRLSLAQRTTDSPSRLGLSDTDSNVPLRVKFP